MYAHFNNYESMHAHTGAQNAYGSFLEINLTTLVNEVLQPYARLHTCTHVKNVASVGIFTCRE